jgi:hypothetical protein
MGMGQAAEAANFQHALSGANRCRMLLVPSGSFNFCIVADCSKICCRFCSSLEPQKALGGFRIVITARRGPLAMVMQINS